MSAQRAELLAHLARSLRETHQPVVREPLPWRFVDLLCALADQEGSAAKIGAEEEDGEVPVNYYIRVR